MLTYSQTTPIVIDHDNTYQADILNSKYKNLRYRVTYDRLVTIDAKYEANLPGLAYDYYGDQEYWRAILMANGLIDPLTEICVGLTLGLPSVESLDAIMAQSTTESTEPIVL
jgi:hypothetical protein